MLYYIAENNGGIYARGLGEGPTTMIYELTPKANHDELFLRESRTAADRWDLILGPERAPAPCFEPRPPSPSDQVVSVDLKCAVPEPPDARAGNFGEFPRFSADKSGWRFHFDGRGGLYGENAKDGRTMDAPLDNLFDWWDIHDPTQLPNGQVVFQLGSGQICVLDADKRKIARLVNGRSPVVIIKPTNIGASRSQKTGTF
jgi:hypothetical protein